MKENWIKELKANQQDYIKQEPDGLWEKVEESLNNDFFSPYKIVGRIPAWAYLSAGMVAAILVGIFLNFPSAEKDIFLPDIKIKKVELNESLTIKTIEKILPKNVSYKGNNAVDFFNNTKFQVRKDEQESEASLKEKIKVEEKENIGDIKEKEGNYREENIYTDDWRDMEFVRKNRKTKKFSMGLYAANFSNKGVFNNSNVSIVRGYLAQNSVVGNKIESDIWLDAQRNKTETNIEHKLPIRTGISFRYDLNDRLSLNSGIIYSKLYSVIKSGSKGNSYKTEQVLNYVGIPLSVDFSLWKKNNFNFYVSGGGAVEKCVYGTVRTDYTVMNRTNNYESKRLKEKQFQFSLNGALGIEYNFTKIFGIYAEPGVSYFINNKSDIKNIYKEKPVNFNVEVGVRIIIGED